jgi:mono/diheme cytochrome c family protein
MEGFTRCHNEAAMRRLVSTCRIFSFVAPMIVGSVVARGQEVDFTRQVRPIFEAKCFACHGPKKQQSDFRLDDKSRAFRGGSEGPAIVPGKAAESPLIDRIAADAEPDQVMPPKGDRLTPDQVALIRTWIDQGAKWPEDATGSASKHWAFVPPVRPSLPKVSVEKWPKNPVDRFVLARLDAEGLKPSPEADRTTLIRRLSLDLIGLPPTPEEVDAFIADPAPDAYEKVVDRLLASPHYGERWGRHWLDAARYADTDGFEKDKTRHVWFYRDWVINAFNRDLPYNRFVVEQLAGDLLPGATQDQIVATGYLRNSMVNEEGGVDPEQFRMEAMFDRVDAIGKGILGLTIQCAQCHTHKFDPISHEEYYRLFAFLNNDDEPTRVVYTPEELQTIAGVRRQVGEAEAALQHSTPDWRERMDRWEDDRAKALEPKWTVVQAPFEDISTGGQKYLLLPDGSFRAAGYAPTKHTGKFSAKVDLPKITAVKLELMNDANLPANGPGRSLWGTCALTEFKVEVGSKERKPIKIARVSADFEQAETPLEAYYDDLSKKKRVVGPASYAIDGKDETAWGMDAGPGRRNVPHEAVFTLEKPIESAEGSELTFSLTQNHGGWNSDDLMTNNLGRFRVSVTGENEAKADPTPAVVRAALAVPRDRRSAAQVATIFGYWRTLVPEWNEANARIEGFWKAYPAGATTLVLEKRSQPRSTAILKRGDFLKPGKLVQPGVPSFLNPLPPDASPDRLSFANWLVDPKSPTTARAFVNRAWQSYFGTGLVATSEDLGTQAEAPSHPELLDWLAVEFMENGWKIKDLHRWIVGSATYRQSSQVRPDLLAKDPYNRLLARGSRLRVEGEIVRDIQLAASGLLNPKLGGPSTMPPAPEFLFQPPASYAPFPWIEAKGPERYRRAVYTWRRRSTPYPLLSTFDVPEGNTACVRRVRSNTPLQALVTLNETLAIEASRALARKTLAEGGKADADRITYAFRRCVGRKPTESETSVLIKLLESQKQRFADGWVSPWEMVTGSKTDRPAEIPKGATPTEWAAYTVVARVLLNLDETITKE